MTKNDIVNLFLTSSGTERSIIEISLSLLIASIFGSIIAFSYSRNRSALYRRFEFYMSLILFCTISAAMTILISDNIVRAFALVGALSIVRFRTAIKSPLDITYLFWSLAVGMGVGSGQYFFSLITLVIIFLIITTSTFVYSRFFNYHGKAYLKLKGKIGEHQAYIQKVTQSQSVKLLDANNFSTGKDEYVILSFKHKNQQDFEILKNTFKDSIIDSWYESQIHI